MLRRYFHNPRPSPVQGSQPRQPSTSAQSKLSAHRQRAHRPIKPLAEPDQPMADAKPNLVHNPAPSDQPCTGPNPMTGQPSPAPQAHNPSWAQPSPAHGSQHATQPSLHSLSPRPSPSTARNPQPKLSPPAQPALSAPGCTSVLIQGPDQHVIKYHPVYMQCSNLQ